MHSAFYSLNSLPLKNKTIVITRAHEQSGESAKLFTSLGAKVIIFPAINIIPPDSWREFDDVVLNATQPDYIIFTSSNAVKMFCERLTVIKKIMDYKNTTVVAVGNKTSAKCASSGIPVSIIPDDFSAMGILRSLSQLVLKDKLIFIPCSAIGRDELRIELEKTGAVVKAVPVYNVGKPDADKTASCKDELQKNKIDLFVFTSPSTFENFISIMEIQDILGYFRQVDVAAIGPTTRTAIEDKGVTVSVQPEEYTIEALAESVIKYYQSKTEN